MKTLVVYYSLDGNTKAMAESIQAAVQGDIMELKPVNDIKSHGFSKFIWGGTQVMMGKKPALEKLDKNIEEYDAIFIGTPVWASTYVPALKTFFDQVSLQNKKVAMFCCYAGQEGKTFQKMRQALLGNEIIGEKGFKDPLKNLTASMNDIKAWAKSLLD